MFVQVEKLKRKAERKAAKKDRRASDKEGEGKKKRQQGSDDDEESNEERAGRKAQKAAKHKVKAECSSEEEDSEDDRKKSKTNNKRKSGKDVEEIPAKKRKGEDGGSVVERALSTAEFRKEFEITITGGDCPDPVQTFDVAGLNTELVKAVKSAGFLTPSPIQSQCWPLLMEGRDLIAIAKTGSGKTCGFLFPAFMQIRNTVDMRPKRGDGPVAVALAP